MSFKKSKNHYKSILEDIKNAGLYKEERFICSPQSGTIDVKFPYNSEEKKLINMCSNNYLGLSNNDEIVKAAHEGLDNRGFGMSSVRFICGTQDIHKELEDKLSSFLGMEDTILFASCFDANAALFEGILGAEDAIFSDALVHASIIDGVRLCKAKRNIYQHSDMQDLEDKLKADKSRIKLIITDGVFSMDGDMANLKDLSKIAKKYDALLAVDDSHATGFIGKTGKGTHQHFDVMQDIDIITTTFGKALGGATGGCISAKKEIVDLLRQKARPYLFSNSVMPAVVNATIKVIDLLNKDTSARDILEKNSLYWRNSLIDLGFDIKEGNTPIVPIMLYDAVLAQNFSKALYDEGVLAIGFFFPVVAKGQARIRTQISAGLERSDIDKALNIFKKVGKSLNVI